MEEEEEERDEREGFSVGGVNVRVGRSSDGGLGDAVIARLPARDRAGLEYGVRLSEEATLLDACEEIVTVSVEALGRCSKRRREEGREVTELVDGRRLRNEESRLYTVLDGSANLEWDRGGGEGPGDGGVGGEGDRCGKWAEDAERKPSVEGRRIVSGSALDSTYWVIARGAGEMRRLRDQFDRRRWGSSWSVDSALILPRSEDE